VFTGKAATKHSVKRLSNVVLNASLCIYDNHAIVMLC
jgi:hypothetical protein